MGKNDRQILEVYKGIVIRKSNVVGFRFSAHKYKELIDEAFSTGLSLPKIIALSSRPCEKCKGVKVVSYNDESEKIEVRRGIIADYTIMNNGMNIFKQNDVDGLH